MSRPNTKEAIIDAAEDAVIEVGASHLTLDAVAERAGISKGGLLYHFPNKDALLNAMLERLFADYQTRRAAVLESLPDSPGRELRAHILVGLSEDEIEKRSRSRKVASAIIAAAANDPKFMGTIRQHCGGIIRRIATTDGVLDSCKLVVLLAVDGLVFWELMGMCPLEPKERDQAFGALLDLADRVSAKGGARCES